MVGVKQTSTAHTRTGAGRTRSISWKWRHARHTAPRSPSGSRRPPARTGALPVVDLHVLEGRDVQLLQRQRVLRVVQVADELCRRAAPAAARARRVWAAPSSRALCEKRVFPCLRATHRRPPARQSRPACCRQSRRHRGRERWTQTPSGWRSACLQPRAQAMGPKRERPHAAYKPWIRILSSRHAPSASIAPNLQRQVCLRKRFSGENRPQRRSRRINHHWTPHMSREVTHVFRPTTPTQVTSAAGRHGV